MYNGQRKQIELVCSNDVMDAIIDKFGKDVHVLANDMKSFRAVIETSVGSVFYSWIFGFGGRVAIKSPEDVKDEYVTASGGAESGDSFSWWLYYALIVLSLALHELGHLVAGVAYGYKISDTGILLLGIIPFGAYVAHEDMEDATKAEKIQFALAGVEVNLLMAGICLILAMQSYQWSRTMFSVANVNVILAGVNLLPASGLDGESALSAACGINSISEVARKWLTNKKRRQKLLRAGLPGYACFCFFSVTMISKVILWLLIGLDVVLVFFNIF